jgi:hypothetical protein
VRVCASSVRMVSSSETRRFLVGMITETFVLSLKRVLLQHHTYFTHTFAIGILPVNGSEFFQTKTYFLIIPGRSQKS